MQLKWCVFSEAFPSVSQGWWSPAVLVTTSNCILVAPLVAWPSSMPPLANGNAVWVTCVPQKFLGVMWKLILFGFKWANLTQCIKREAISTWNQNLKVWIRDFFFLNKGLYIPFSTLGLPLWVKNLPAIGRPGFNPWVGKIPWRRERLPTPVFWPGECHGLGHRESDMTEWLHFTSSPY